MCLLGLPGKSQGLAEADTTRVKNKDLTDGCQANVTTETMSPVFGCVVILRVEMSQPAMPFFQINRGKHRRKDIFVRNFSPKFSCLTPRVWKKCVYFLFLCRRIMTVGI